MTGNQSSEKRDFLINNHKQMIFQRYSLYVSDNKYELCKDYGIEIHLDATSPSHAVDEAKRISGYMYAKVFKIDAYSVTGKDD